MARALTAVGALLVLALLVLGLVIYVNRDEDGIAVDNLLSEKITRAIGTAEDRGADVDLRRIANFEWDELVIARRDATRTEITRELGRPWTGDLEFRAGDILIFLRNGELTRFADYRGEGRFEGIDRPFAHFDRERAVFRVRALVIRPRTPPS